MPDLIILDLLMPQPTGLEILRTLRGEAATKNTPVMVISNSSMQRVVDEVTSLGADYIVKADLSLKELAGRVEKRLAAVPPPAPAASPAGVRPLAVQPVRVPARPPAPAPAAPPATPAEPAPVAETAPAPAPANDKEPRILPERKPVLDHETVECAGCGSIIGINVRFCPKCGRQLLGATGGRSWRPVSR